jgi:hypothetical protein
LGIINPLYGNQPCARDKSNRELWSKTGIVSDAHKEPYSDKLI